MSGRLWTVRAHDRGAGLTYAVRSMLPLEPVPGDRIRYGDALELEVTARVLDLAGGAPTVLADVVSVRQNDDWPAEQTFAALKFRLEAPA